VKGESANKEDSANTDTYIFHVRIVLGPAPMASSSSTSADYDNISGTLQHIGQNTVPSIPLGEIEAAGTMKFFQISELVGILWIDNRIKRNMK
jgi:hypothetical protein